MRASCQSATPRDYDCECDMESVSSPDNTLEATFVEDRSPHGHSLDHAGMRKYASEKSVQPPNLVEGALEMVMAEPKAQKNIEKKASNTVLNPPLLQRLQMGNNQNINPLDFSDQEIIEPDIKGLYEAMWQSVRIIKSDLGYSTIVGLVPLLLLLLFYLPASIFKHTTSVETMAKYYHIFALLISYSFPFLSVWVSVYYVFGSRFATLAIFKYGLICLALKMTLYVLFIIYGDEIYSILNKIWFSVSVFIMGYFLYKDSQPFDGMQAADKLGYYLIHDGTLIDCIKISLTFVLSGNILAFLIPIYLESDYTIQFVIKVFIFELLVYLQESYQNYLMLSKSVVGAFHRLMILYPFDQYMQFSGRLMTILSGGSFIGLVEMCLASALIEIAGQWTYAFRYRTYRYLFFNMCMMKSRLFSPQIVPSATSVVPGAIPGGDNHQQDADGMVNETLERYTPLANRYYRMIFMSSIFRIQVFNIVFSSVFIYLFGPMLVFKPTSEVSNLEHIIALILCQLLIVVSSRFLCLVIMIYQGRYPTVETPKVTIVLVIYELCSLFNVLSVLYNGFFIA